MTWFTKFAITPNRRSDSQPKKMNEQENGKMEEKAANFVFASNQSLKSSF